MTFSTSGEIHINADTVNGPAGSANNTTAPGAPLPQLPAGALVGRIGNTTAFAIGSTDAHPDAVAGQLFLGINDSNLRDNPAPSRFRSPVKAARSAVSHHSQKATSHCYTEGRLPEGSRLFVFRVTGAAVPSAKVPRCRGCRGAQVLRALSTDGDGLE